MIPEIWYNLSIIFGSSIAWKLGHMMCDRYHANKSAADADDEYEPRWAAYGLSFVHAIAATIAGAVCLYETPPSGEMCNADARWRNTCLLVSCGYFAQDLLSEVRQPRIDYGMIFHHIFVGFFIFIAVQMHIFTQVLGLFLLNEGSTPFLCIRWELKRIERTKGWTPAQETLYFRNGLVLLFMFFACRVFLIPAVWTQALLAGCLDPSTYGDDTVKTVAAYIGNVNFPVLWLMNCYWYYLLVNGAIKVIFGTKESKEKGPTLSSQLKNPAAENDGSKPDNKEERLLEESTEGTEPQRGGAKQSAKGKTAALKKGSVKRSQ